MRLSRLVVGERAPEFIRIEQARQFVPRAIVDGDRDRAARRRWVGRHVFRHSIRRPVEQGRRRGGGVRGTEELGQAVDDRVNVVGKLFDGGRVVEVAHDAGRVRRMSEQGEKDAFRDRDASLHGPSIDRKASLIIE